MESESSNPRRRQRQGPLEVTHDSEVWFEDGNVVLACAADPDTLIAFRVHKGMLSAHCEMFRDMFSVCQVPPEGEGSETYEGCPLVVTQDTPVDMRRFLQAITSRPLISYARDITKLTLHELASLLRLATKYIFPALREEIIAHLKVLYPSTLKAFRSEARIKILPSDFNGIIGVNLGRECNVNAILPVAYYLCYRMPSRVAIEWIQVKGTDERVKLPYEASVTLAVFRDRMQTRIHAETMKACPPFRLRLCDNAQCADVHWMSMLYCQWIASFTAPQVDVFNESLPEGRECEACRRRLREITSSHDIPARIWALLPFMCDLVGWETATSQACN